MKVLGVSGSLREASHNKQLLEFAGGEMPSGVELVLFEGLEDVPAFNQDDEAGPPPAARAFLDAIAAADALLFATPEYNSSVPGALKNALDWASRPFPENVLRDKPAAVIGASTGMFGAVWAQAELRKVLSASGAKVIDEELPVGHADHAFDEMGRLAEPAAAERLRDIVDELVANAERLADATTGGGVRREQPIGGLARSASPRRTRAT